MSVAQFEDRRDTAGFNTRVVALELVGEDFGIVGVAYDCGVLDGGGKASTVLEIEHVDAARRVCPRADVAL